MRGPKSSFFSLELRVAESLLLSAPELAAGSASHELRYPELPTARITLLVNNQDPCLIYGLFLDSGFLDTMGHYGLVPVITSEKDNKNIRLLQTMGFGFLLVLGHMNQENGILKSMQSLWPLCCQTWTFQCSSFLDWCWSGSDMPQICACPQHPKYP